LAVNIQLIFAIYHNNIYTFIKKSLAGIVPVVHLPCGFTVILLSSVKKVKIELSNNKNVF